jgi:hypothetical protein
MALSTTTNANAGLWAVIVVSKQAAIFVAEDTASILSGEDINATELPIRHNQT